MTEGTKKPRKRPEPRPVFVLYEQNADGSVSFLGWTKDAIKVLETCENSNAMHARVPAIK